jgi:hypothetical protein
LASDTVNGKVKILAVECMVFDNAISRESGMTAL